MLIRPGNILIDNEFRAKIADFGLAREFSDKGFVLFPSNQSIDGTPLYKAPEACSETNRALTTKADLYALGLIYFEVLSGFQTMHEKYKSIKDLNTYKLLSDDFEYCFPQESQLIKSLIVDDPFSRPSCQEIYESVSYIELEQLFRTKVS